MLGEFEGGERQSLIGPGGWLLVLCGAVFAGFRTFLLLTSIGLFLFGMLCFDGGLIGYHPMTAFLCILYSGFAMVCFVLAKVFSMVGQKLGYIPDEEKSEPKYESETAYEAPPPVRRPSTRMSRRRGRA